jgi:mono/diheme cytochrome c family protein
MRTFSFILCLWLPGVSTAAAAAPPDEAALLLREQGAFLARVGGCADCHTQMRYPHDYMAGGYPLVTPFGTFYTPNLTPDPGTGIGTWREKDFRRALRRGISKDGTPLYPAFPYPSYTKMTDEDIHALYVYFRSLPPVVRVNREHELSFPLAFELWLPPNRRPYMRLPAVVWRDLYLEQGPIKPREGAKWSKWNRGAYLVEAVAHCAECHTSRDVLGGLDKDLWMAGSYDEIKKKVIPNLTPAVETGLASWSPQAFKTFLVSGVRPDGTKSTDPDMGMVIQNMPVLPPEDMDALVEYLRALPPIERVWP